MRKKPNLEKQFADLDRQLRKDPTANLLQKVEATCSALDQFLTQKAEASIFHAKHRLFEIGDNPRWLLAHLVAGRQGYRAISSLKDDIGRTHYETKMFVKIIEKFHKKLSYSEVTTHLHCIQEFLDELNLGSGYQAASRGG